MANTQHASDFRFENIAIESEIIGGDKSLQNMFMEVNIYEDLFQPYMSCNILVSDSMNIPLNLPIVGDENINIQFKTAGLPDSTNYNFKVYSISGRKQIKQNQQAYVIEGISEIAIHNQQNKVNKSYRNKLVSDIVADIMSDPLDPFDFIEYDVETTSDTIDCIIPNWKPVDAIDWLSKRAIGLKGQSDFLFYESGGGKQAENKMNFKSLRTLLEDEPDPNNILNRLVMDVAGKDKFSHLNPNRVLGWYVDNDFNMIDNINYGMYGGKLLTYDPIKKKAVETTFDYFSDWDANEHLEDYPVLQDLSTGGVSKSNITSENFQGYVNSKYTFSPKHFNQFTNSEKDNKIDRWFLQRQSVLQQFDNYTLQVVVTGCSAMEVGQVVYFDLPSIEQKPRNQIGDLDKHHSGKFLITSIRHMIKRDGYQMVLELKKDSLQHSVLHTAKVVQ